MKKYPKLILLIVSIIIAIVFFQNGKDYPPFRDFLSSLGVMGVFISGFFYAYGFTAAPATSVLLVLAKEQNILIAGLVAGLGALLSDIIIFNFIRHSFNDEIEKLKQEKGIKYLKKTEKKIFGSFYKYILPVFAGFIIASPLPTEIGVSMLASLKNLSIHKFMFVAYLLHTTGIMIILLIGRTI
jgi:hypothetical protein